MKFRCATALIGIALVSVLRAESEVLERVEQLLTFSSAEGEVRARLSGTVELEGYVFPQPAPGYIASRGDALFNPRLTTFLDVQVGTKVYAFAQFRADRGFDPGARHLRGRLDEYALRFRLSEEGRLNLQIGKFATVVGNWVTRHGAWENPFVTAPLVYENLTAIWDDAAAQTSEKLLGWAHIRPRSPRDAPATDKRQRLPVIWGPSYTTGAAVSGRLGRMTYAVEMKNASIASRPRAWDVEDFHWRHPTWSGRLGYRPNQMWNMGLSGSTGTYLLPQAAPTLVPGYGLGDYRQTVIAHDIGFAWHHLQVWAEVFGTRFSIPRVGDADTFAYYVEAKYKITPQLFGAVRWNEQLFGRIADAMTGDTRWGFNTRRFDLVGGYRFSAHTQLKVQYSLQHEEHAPREVAHLLSLQLMMRF